MHKVRKTNKVKHESMKMNFVFVSDRIRPKVDQIQSFKFENVYFL